MNSTTMIREDALVSFETQGYAILPEFFSPTVLADARQAVQEIADAHVQNLRVKGHIRNTFDNEAFESRLIRVYEESSQPIITAFRPELHKAGLYNLFFHPMLLDIIEHILGPEIRLYPNYSVRPKLPDNEATLVLWHQDAGYTEEMNNDGAVATARMVNVWTPLVPASVENGCMEFIPRTHKLGLVPHARKNKFYLQISDDHLDPYLPEAIPIPLDPGDVVIFSNLLFHRGLPNRSQHIRWSIDWRYQDANQSTFRAEQGHIARSKLNPSSAVQNAREWAQLSFG